ncbi:MAG TPA: hypothetical protein VGB73_10205 [Pyrinomonadaceae bacterium]
MLVVYASRHDATAQALVARWAEHDAALLTAADLSVAGWRYHLDSPDDSTAIVSGRRVEARRISGVLIRWPFVHERELSHIIPEDRAYVASEMFAFLLGWLTQLKCPVLNRPTPTNLLGPSWRHEQWIHTAAKLGIRVRPARRHVRMHAPHTPDEQSQMSSASQTTVIVVGDESFGANNPLLDAYARRLARAAGVGLLAVYFDGDGADAALTGANLWPELVDDEVIDAVLAHLLRPSHAESSGGR